MPYAPRSLGMGGPPCSREGGSEHSAFRAVRVVLSCSGIGHCDCGFWASRWGFEESQPIPSAASQDWEVGFPGPARPARAAGAGRGGKGCEGLPQGRVPLRGPGEREGDRKWPEETGSVCEGARRSLTRRSGGLREGPEGLEQRPQALGEHWTQELLRTRRSGGAGCQPVLLGRYGERLARAAPGPQLRARRLRSWLWCKASR